MGRSCSTCERGEKCIPNFRLKPDWKILLEDIGIDGV
jgi:hypothetical protein